MDKEDIKQLEFLVDRVQYTILPQLEDIIIRFEIAVKEMDTPTSESKREKV